MTTKKLSTTQYAKLARMSRQNVLYHIKRDGGMSLKAVHQVENIAGRNILYTDTKKLATMLQK